MPLQYQTINIPFGFGMADNTHPFVLKGPMLRSLINGRIDKSGAVVKRLGWADRGGYTGLPGAGLITVPRRLIVLNRNTITTKALSVGLYDKNATPEQTWDQSGAGGTQSLSEIYVTGRDSVSHESYDFASGGGVIKTRPDFGYEPQTKTIVYCWLQVRSAGDPSIRVFATVLDAVTRQQLVPARDISAAAVGASRLICVKPRVVRQGTDLFVVFGRTSDTDSIWAARLDCDTKAWSAAVNIANDWDGGFHDVHEFVDDEGSAWFMSYTRGGNEIHFQKMNVTTVTAANSIGPGGITTATVHCIFAQSGASFWVGWFQTVAGAPSVRVRPFDTGLVAATFADIVIETGTDPDTGAERTLIMGFSSTASATIIGLFWTSGAFLRFPSNNVARPVSKFCRITTAGSVSGIARRKSIEMITRPWRAGNGCIYSNYVYNAGIAATTEPGEMNEYQRGSRGFCTAFTVCVVDNTTLTSGTLTDFNNNTWRAAATWAIGEASSRNPPVIPAGSSNVDLGHSAGFGPAGDEGTAEFALQQFVISGVADPVSLAIPSGRYGVNACRMVIDDANDIPIFATTIGENVVFSGGTPSIYDGQNVTEYGFLWPPEGVVATVSGSGGALSAGNYIASAVWSYRHATGDRVESIPIVARDEDGATALTVVANGGIGFEVEQLTLTKKYFDVTGATGTDQIDQAFAPVAQIYRTEANQSSLYSEGEEALNARRPNEVYVIQVPLVGIAVTAADTFARAQRNLYTTGDVLPNYPPPSLRHIATHRGRIFGISAENPREIRFTHIYEPGELPGWHPFLSIFIPERATALASLDDKLIIFCDSSIYVLAGTGPDKKGLNSDYTEPQRLNAPHGTRDPQTIASYPDGIFFLSEETGTPGVPGIYLLNRKLEVSRTAALEDSIQIFRFCHGAAVDYVNERVYWAFCDSPRARDTTGGVTIIYDWRHNAWMGDLVFYENEGNERTATHLTGLGVLDGILYATMPQENSLFGHTGYADPGNQFITTLIQTAWLPLAQLQGFQRYRWLSLLGQVVEGHDLTVDIFTDYNVATVQTKTFTAAEIAALKYDHLKIHIRDQRATAISVDISDDATGVNAGFAIVGLSIEAALKAPQTKLPQAAMR